MKSVMKSAGSYSTALNSKIADAIRCVGTESFYQSLVDLLGVAAPHDLAALVRYSRGQPPDLILPIVPANEPLKAYLKNLYLFDPFYLHWNDRGETGVYRLRALDSGLHSSRYAREFLTAMSIYDEIAVFLPPMGDASTTLILDRADASFKESEVGRVRALFPVIDALHKQHIGIFVATGVDTELSPFGRQRALRLTDKSGNVVFATGRWKEAEAKANPEFQKALSVVSSRGPCSVSLPGSGVLRRTRLSLHFGPAPGGFCDEVTIGNAVVASSPVDGLPSSLAEKLTSREQQIVVLTLLGYPIVKVASKLGVSFGTIKNHRLNIYRKLDITTERELFGEYLTAMREQSSAKS